MTGANEAEATSRPVISVEGYEKAFKTSLFKAPSIGARQVSFQVREGEIFGFLGPNGAGKTTTIKALLALIRPDRGKIELFGEDVALKRWRSRVGYMPEHPTFYDYLTGLEMVTWFARLAGLSSGDAERQARATLERVGLSHAMTRRLRGYSKGMLQRAGLAQALVGSPSLLILDEPMTGLDPLGRRDIRDLILSLRDEGKTIFYSTHILPDVEMTCDRVCILHKGKSVREGRLTDILSETTRGFEVVVSGLSEARTKELAARVESIEERDGQLQLSFSEADSAQAFINQIVSEGGKIERFVPHRDDLEQIFVRSLGEGGEAK